MNIPHAPHLEPQVITRGYTKVLCARCREVKPASDFPLDSRRHNGCASYCYDCGAAKQAEYREAFKAEGRADHDKAKRREYLFKIKYGITVEEYEKRLAEQNGVCAICSRKPEESKNGVLHVDHCHDSRKFRGLLCDSCNITLGRFNDDPERFIAAAAYLLQNVDVLERL